MKRGWWIALSFLVLLGGAFYVALHHKTPDEFAAFKGKATRDEVRYYNAKDFAKIYTLIGVPAPPLLDMQVRRMNMTVTNCDSITQLIEDLARKRHWKPTHAFHKPDVMQYSPSGTRSLALGIQPSLTYTAYDMSDLSTNVRHRYEITIMDAQYFTWWDQLEVRSEHGGKIKWTDPVTER